MLTFVATVSCAIAGDVIKSHVAAKAQAECERLISTGQEELEREHLSAALASFEAATGRLDAGWGAKLLSRHKRESLRCRTCTGAARSLLLLGAERLREALQYANAAKKAAELCSADEKMQLLPAANHALVDVLLAQSIAFGDNQFWAGALEVAARAVSLAADAEDQERADRVHEVARRGRFMELLGISAAELLKTEWADAEKYANEALGLACGPQEREQTKKCRHQAKQGAFDALVNTANSFLQQRRFYEAERAAVAAQDAAFNDATRGHAATTLAYARRGQFADKLAKSDAAIDSRRWDEARLAAKRAREFEADDADRAAVEARITAAREGEFNEFIALGQIALQQRNWCKAIQYADGALRLVADAAERTRVEQMRHSGSQGLFDEAVGKAQTHLQHRRFAEAEREAEAARRVAFDTVTRAQTDAVMKAARRGQFDAAIEICAHAFENQRWDAAIEAAICAQKHAFAAEEKRDADGRRKAARACKCDAFLSQAAAHLSAGRWSQSHSAATEAQKCADDASRVARSSSAARAVSEAKEAAEAAVIVYCDAVDDFIRRRPDFTTDTPLLYQCKIAVILQKCKKPAAIPFDVVAVLRSNEHMFKVVREGAAVCLTRLTPWRGSESHRVFGDFRCRCGKRWSSASTFCDKQQACKSCDKWSYPYAQRPLDRRNDSDDEVDFGEERRPHDMERCERCRQLGRCCLPNSNLVSTRPYY